jgi:hypothetical protein
MVTTGYMVKHQYDSMIHHRHGVLVGWTKPTFENSTIKISPRLGTRVDYLEACFRYQRNIRPTQNSVEASIT